MCCQVNKRQLRTHCKLTFANNYHPTHVITHSNGEQTSIIFDNRLIHLIWPRFGHFIDRVRLLWPLQLLAIITFGNRPLQHFLSTCKMAETQTPNCSLNPMRSKLYATSSDSNHKSTTRGIEY